MHYYVISMLLLKIFSANINHLCVKPFKNFKMKTFDGAYSLP